ncbi:MAG: helix-turn-helix domain-containing protein [Deltaproteobacteria bacterium]|nr:helix-turn-helix domain-containing protein [Deltaproteobacteria bacterium]
MKTGEINLTCNLKALRQARGMSQSQLAELIGVKRQAIYDIETGKYTPNTALALRLAKYLQCTVEDLFVEEVGGEEAVTLVDDVVMDSVRVALARIRGRLMAYPLTGKRLLLEGFEPADGVMSVRTGSARLLSPASSLDQTLILFGCDPAFSILGTHTMRQAPHVRVHCLFASSRNALVKLAAGQAHLAGTHMHSTAEGDGNLLLARELLQGRPATVLAFSHIEEGLMVAPGNPLDVRSVADLGAGRARLVNREPGAALRSLLDAHLDRLGIPGASVTGYDRETGTHHDSAINVLFGRADVALGFRAIAESYGLDFVPVETVRCDLVVPKDLQSMAEVGSLLDTLQTRKMREDLLSLPGYDARDTGKIIAEL